MGGRLIIETVDEIASLTDYRQAFLRHAVKVTSKAGNVHYFPVQTVRQIKEIRETDADWAARLGGTHS